VVSAYEYFLRGRACGTDKKLAVDFVGRYEEIGGDYEKLRGILSLGEPLPVINKTLGRRPYQNYFSDKTAAIIEKVYSDDI